MRVELEPGRYIVAVSGGVDSVVLLNTLSKLSGLQLTVAHFDHGIREESAEDRRFVMALAHQYGLPFVYDRAELGRNASEAKARKARYDFLHKVRETSGAKAIVTAHHQDDLLETAIINLLRGTGRRGLTSLKNSDIVRRPLLGVSKSRLIRYAQEHGLEWREDQTNLDTKYLRNHVRKNIISKFSPRDKQKLLALTGIAALLNEQIEKELINQLHVRPAFDKLDRHWFTMLPHDVAKEVMTEWLRQNGIMNYDTQALERLVHGAKTLQAGRVVDIMKGYWLAVSTDGLALVRRNR